MRIAAAAPISDEEAVAPQLHKQLRSRIISCDLFPGQRISESDVASTYDVSRQPVREAFIKLAEEQLIRIVPQRGTFVRRISIAAVLTVRFVREAAEADLVRKAVQRGGPDMVTALDKQIERQRKLAENGNPGGFMRLDEVFHRSIARFGGEPAVWDCLESLNVQMTRVRNISAREFAPEILVVQHARIVDAMRDVDADKAEEAMRMHLRQINEDLPQIVAAHPDYFEDIEAMDQS